MPNAPTRDQVFISYSHEDAGWLQRLQVHFAPFERAGKMQHWDDTMITAGSNWREHITSALDRTRVAVLLVSADFLASDFIATEELPRLLSAAENDGVVIIPVILHPCAFDRMESLSQFQAINLPSQPLSALNSTKREQILVKLATAVDSVLNPPVSSPALTGMASGRLCDVPSRNPLFGGREPLFGQISDALSDSRRVVRFLDLPEWRSPDQTLAVAAVSRWFTQNTGWLAVLDNVDDLSLAKEFLPGSENGHLIITTRMQATTAIARSLRLLHELGYYLYQRGHYQEATSFIERALSMRQAIHGTQHADYGRTLAIFGLLMQACGKLMDAERSSQEALVVLQSALGAEHEEVARVTGHLAGLKLAQGQLVDAEALFHRSPGREDENIGTTEQPIQTQRSPAEPPRPYTCVQGYVWREAFPGDKVCVTPAFRERTRRDNEVASRRVMR